MLKSIKKIIWIIILITLTSADIVFVGSYFTTQVMAVKDSVKLGTYFILNNEYINETNVDINNNDIKLHFNIQVEEGYLKDSQIEISNANYNIIKEQEESEFIQNIDFENNIIYLNQSYGSHYPHNGRDRK